jgi:cytochrome P450
MMNGITIDPSVPTVVGLVAAGISVLTAVYWWSTDGSEAGRESGRYEHPLPPHASHGFLATLRGMSSVHFHDWALALARNEAKIVRLSLWPLVPWNTHFMIVSDPKVGRKILEHPKALKARALYEFFDQLVGGTCFISEEGERYRHPRKAALVGMSHNTMDDMVKQIHEVMDGWIPRALGGEVNQVDIGREMQKCTIHSIGKIAFGYEISEQEQEATVRNIGAASYEFALASEIHPWRKIPTLGPMLFAGRRHAERCVQEMRALCSKMLHHHRSEKSEKERERAVVLDALASNDKGKAAGGEEADIVSDMLLLYAAGFDTTGYTISFALMELARNRDIQTELRKELGAAASDDGERKRYDSPLLKRVVKETLRCWSVAAGGGARIIPEDMVVKSDDGQGGERLMTLPKDSYALITTYTVLRDRDTFERPDEWLPSRWEEPTQDMKDAFFPFLTGRRSCPGQLLALYESEIFLARLVKDYEWSIVKEVPPEYTITLKIKGTILQARKVA